MPQAPGLSLKHRWALNSPLRRGANDLAEKNQKSLICWIYTYMYICIYIYNLCRLWVDHVVMSCCEVSTHGLQLVAIDLFSPWLKGLMKLACAFSRCILWFSGTLYTTIRYQELSRIITYESVYKICSRKKEQNKNTMKIVITSWTMTFQFYMLSRLSIYILIYIYIYCIYK